MKKKIIYKTKNYFKIFLRRKHKYLRPKLSKKDKKDNRARYS